MKFTITTSVGRGSRANSELPKDVGELTNTSEGVWILNSKSPLPLTVVGASRELALQLKDTLDQEESWHQKIPDLAFMIAQHKLQFKEVNAFTEKYRRQLELKIIDHISNSNDWSTASEKDREDMRAEFEVAALESLGVFVSNTDLSCLLSGEPAEFAANRELLRQFNGASSLYSFYLTQLGRNNSIVTVKADDYGRKFWELLVEKNLARRGKDIPIELILDSLRLKDLNDILEGVIPKPLGRKAKAIGIALELPDLQIRLSERISFREIFQVILPHDINITNLAASFAYATALASAVQQTYLTGIDTLDAIDERKQNSEFYDGWEIKNWTNPLPSCAVGLCKKYERLPTKRPPFHIGCNCQLECSLKD